MNEQQFFDRLNEKTAANHRKHQAENKAILRHAKHHTAAVRRRNRLIALNMSLVGAMGMALGVLIMYIV